MPHSSMGCWSVLAWLPAEHDQGTAFLWQVPRAAGMLKAKEVSEADLMLNQLVHHLCQFAQLAILELSLLVRRLS